MPEVSQVHIDAALTNLSVAYRNANFIAADLAPSVAVRKQSDKYFVYDADRERFRQTFDQRAPGTEAAEIDFKLSSDSYFADDHALTSAIPDEERDNADPALAPAIDRTEFLTDKIDLNREADLAAQIVSDPSIPGETLAGTDQWSDTSSDPLQAVEDAKAAILEAVQALPNTLVLPYQVYSKVRVHPLVKEMVAAAELGAAGPDTLAQIFDVERVLVPRAFRNASLPGNAPQMEYVWGKNALLCHTPARPGLKTISLAYTFVWAAAPGSVEGHVVEVWREPRRKADMIRVQKYYDQKIVAPEAGFLWQDAVA